MSDSDATKDQDRPQRPGGLASAAGDVAGHAAPETAPVDDPETTGHLLGTHPYTLEQDARVRRQELQAEADRARLADRASDGRGLGQRILDRVRGREGSE